MCQDETKIISGIARTGVALASGALFGMAAQTALRYVGLDLASVHGELIVNGAARLALVPGVWWFLAIAAFFAGPLSVLLARRFLAGRRLFRGPRLLAWAVLVLGVVTLAYLVPARGFGAVSCPSPIWRRRVSAWRARRTGSWWWRCRRFCRRSAPGWRMSPKLIVHRKRKSGV